MSRTNFTPEELALILRACSIIRFSERCEGVLKALLVARLRDDLGAPVLARRVGALTAEQWAALGRSIRDAQLTSAWTS